MDILATELVSIEKIVFHFQVVDLVKMYWILEQIRVLLLISKIKKDILVLGKGPTQGLEHTLTSEKVYLISFTVNGKVFCLGLHYNGANSYLFVNGTKMVKFTAKDSEIVATSLRLGNISKDWSEHSLCNNKQH